MLHADPVPSLYDPPSRLRRLWETMGWLLLAGGIALLGCLVGGCRPCPPPAPCEVCTTDGTPCLQCVILASQGVHTASCVSCTQSPLSREQCRPDGGTP